MSEKADSSTGSPSRLLRATSVVSVMTLLSRVLGLVRDMVFSRFFGASAVMDAFFVAFKIPNLLRRFFAEGAFAQAFVPVVGEYRSQRSLAETRELVDAVTGTLSVGLFAITTLGVLAAPLLIMLFAPGFIGETARYPLAVDMLRFTFPYLFFISLTALAGGILNTYRRFAVPAFTPVLLNLALIVFAALIAPRMERPGMGLAMGVFVAGAAQLAFQAPFLLRLGLLPRPRWGLAHEGVRRILKLMGPAIFGSSVAQINILFDTLIASFLATGSISWLYYSDRLMEFPLGVFGIALATVILPNLSQQHAEASAAAFSDTLEWALRLVLIIGAPAALGLIMLAAPMLTTIFYGGQFNAADVDMAAASLMAYAFGLVGFILVKVLSPGYFARQDTRTPVRIGVIALVTNMVLNVVIVVSWVRAGWAAPHAGLALATTVAAFLNAGMLLRGLLQARVYRPGGGWLTLAGQVLLASLAMTGFLWWAAAAPGDWLSIGVFDRVVALGVAVIGGMSVYFGTLFFVGLRPADLRGKASGGSL
jgi:putative peptidoglycan lipid II flippase